VFRKLRTRNISPTQAVKPAPAHTDTVIGAGATLQGTLITIGNVRVEGTSEGDITAKGKIVIGAAGKVEGNIKGQSVAIGGTVEGDVEAARISVLSSGRVMGDLTTASLTTQEGGFIQGVITMQDEDAVKKDVKLPAELEAQVVEAVEAGEKKPKE
jgi:cytoskeletal protein CcmA (bactofilin family)